MVPELFGSMVFNDKVMQERLPKSTYKALRKTMENGEPLDITVANVVAIAVPHISSPSSDASFLLGFSIST